MPNRSRGCVLVVEDDASIRRGLVDALAFAGYEALESGDGRAGLDHAIESTVDLVLLDVLLPKLDGFAVLEGIRRSRPTLPVIMITARGAEEDRVRGLRNGADDYVVKPFSAREVLARVEAVLRRSAERPMDVAELRRDGWRVDLRRREVVGPSGGEATPLSEREAGILRFLAANRGRCVDRQELLRHVWGLDPRGIESRTVDMHIARLRDKLGESGGGGVGSAGSGRNGRIGGGEARFIATVRAKGYMLCEGVACEPAP